jgi:hypothetical protein
MTSLFGYSVPKNVVNKKLYLSIKNKINKSIKGRRWGAYDSGRLVKMYKNAGGKYTGKKGKTNLYLKIISSRLDLLIKFIKSVIS